jgi:hypothetical protein
MVAATLSHNPVTDGLANIGAAPSLANDGPVGAKSKVD